MRDYEGDEEKKLSDYNTECEVAVKIHAKLVQRE